MASEQPTEQAQATGGDSSQATPTGEVPEPTPQSQSSNPPDAGSKTREKPSMPGFGRQPPSSDTGGPTSPDPGDRVFPIRSVVSVAPTPTPSQSAREGGYFGVGRRHSLTSGSDTSGPASRRRQSNEPTKDTGRTRRTSGQPLTSPRREYPHRTPAQLMSDISFTQTDNPTSPAHPPSASGAGASSVMSEKSSLRDVPLVTARFKHVVSEGGHMVITGRDGETLQRCEDEPIHIPGAVQSFGLLVALNEETDGRLVVRVVSENSKNIIGYTPRQLFGLESFSDILSEEQADNMLDHIDFIRDEDADVETNGPEVFTMSIRPPGKRSRKVWCAMHINPRNPDLIICEFELEDDQVNPLVPSENNSPEMPEDTLHSDPTDKEFVESTQAVSKPLRVLRSARKRKGEAAAMEVFNIMSQVQEQLAAAPNLDQFLKVLVGVVKELTGFHRVMIYQFDQQWNGRVVTELVDPRATKDLYKGLNFPASDIPKQARDLYKINRVRLLYDRDQETARLVCRTIEDLETPLDLTYGYLRAMSPIHIKYLANMAVRSSMSISINAFNELWGLISCHTYGQKGMRVSFPIRKMCRLVGDSASRNIERLSYASRLQATKLINTVPTKHNPSGYIIASSEDLLKLFNADFGLLSIRDETKILGEIEQSQEVLAMLEYFRMRKVTSVTSSQEITKDFPDLRYAPGFSYVAGALIVPLSVGGNDFIVFFRRGQLKEVKWAGNPYEKFVREGTEGYLEPRKSFKMWSETVVGSCREWTEEEIETAAVLCLVYGKFIEVWRQKEAAMQNSQLTRLLLANSAHEVRTPLNAIINYLEIALEGSLDQETRDNLSRSHSASKSLIYVINDLLDLTKTEEGGELIKDEVFDLKATLKEATEMFQGDARRKNLQYDVIEHPGLPDTVVGDQRKVRQAISNIAANAIQNTNTGSVRIEMFVSEIHAERVEIEVVVTDTGIGMSSKKLDALFRELEQVQADASSTFDDNFSGKSKALPDTQQSDRTLGLGLAVVARIVRNMNGQLRLKSEEGKGSRFGMQLAFDLADRDASKSVHESKASIESSPDSPEQASSPNTKEVTLVSKDSQQQEATSLARENSTESIRSRRSNRSLQSAAGSTASGGSARSDVDRLIEAIQEPHVIDTRPSGPNRGTSSRSLRAQVESRQGQSSQPSSPTVGRHRRAKSLDTQPVEDKGKSVTTQESQHPGELKLDNMLTSIKPVKVPEDSTTIVTPQSPQSGILGEVDEEKLSLEDINNDKNMHVLVAEDDPVNSKIVEKRLSKLEHRTRLTVNGEECAAAFEKDTADFDVVLMDMQMPIVDGLTSAKMIRSHEKANPDNILSPRARLNGRIPIIAVSASLIEKDKDVYTAAGFDAWILKPISFNRLSELLKGIVDLETREQCLYKPGHWENGGWFHRASETPEAITKPDPFKPDPFNPSGNLEGEESDQGVEDIDTGKETAAAASTSDDQGMSTPTTQPVADSSEPVE